MNNEETETIVEQENRDSIIISTQEMIRDARERRGKKLTEFQCKTCDYKSPSITLLEKHEKAYHKATVVHNCEECDKIFTRTADLNPEMGDTIGIGIGDRYFGLRYQVSVSVSLRSR